MKRRKKENKCTDCGVQLPVGKKGYCIPCLGAALDRYTDPSDPEYDPEFDREIRQTRPDWFINHTLN
jgi:hypothetical protein